MSFFVDPSFVSRHTKWNAPLYRYMIKHNKTSYLCGSGDTALMVHYWINSKEKYKYYVQGIINGAKRTIIQSYYIQTRNWRNGRTNFCTSLMVISQFGMSTHSLLGNINASKTIRIPIPIQKYKYTPNIVKDKIVFFHGVPTREEAKGTQLYVRHLELWKRNMEMRQSLFVLEVSL